MTVTGEIILMSNHFPLTFLSNIFFIALINTVKTQFWNTYAADRVVFQNQVWYCPHKARK